MSELEILKTLIDELNRIDFGTTIKFLKIGDKVSVEITKEDKKKKAECCKSISKTEFAEVKEVSEIVEKNVNNESIINEEKTDSEEVEEVVHEQEIASETEDQPSENESENEQFAQPEETKIETETKPEAVVEEKKEDTEEDFEDCPVLGTGFSPDTEECQFCFKEFPGDYEKCKTLTLERKEKEKGKKKTKKGEKKTKVAKNRSKFGHGADTVGGVIDAFLINGESYGVIVDHISNTFNISQGKVRSLVNGHYNHLLTKHGVQVGKLETISAKTPYTCFLKLN